ncbi:C4-dicarboxylate ABC transporter substrate-binding protein [Methylobacterium sp. WL103]|uniref:TAXI family TRAP transporter solute-binding subunit n=1 Tax=Methylobacterium sp. WL103 TaxID=2603891 RepID=UPI0011C834A1|nr:TAXI family TRAP transporter solute-binding subunit [Methylobacterium sp. WL103]TXN04809.1 C4-dicarboxylate ABC transporter substrate-binding protein [Methylobacterium sp. WL103]
MRKVGAPIRRVVLFCAPLLALAVAGFAYAYLARPTTLVVAVAPNGGSEPALMRAYADALAKGKASIRLRIVPFDGVRESAEALRDGKADLAVVRPDVMLPRNGLTLAVLREQATFVVAPRQAGMDGFPALAGKRLGILAPRKADHALVRSLVRRHGLELRDDVPEGEVHGRVVALVPVEEGAIGRFLSEGRIAAVILLTTPTSSAAQRIVGIVRGADANGEATLFGAPDAASTLARLPRLQAVTIPAGLYDGQQRLPAEDVPTVGSSYRLMARATLSRSVAAEVTQHLFEMRALLSEATPAAEDVTHPAYDTTVGATSARLAIHPGAIDYYEREQESLIERYESWIYLLAILGGGLGSVAAWLRQRIGRIRRERIEVATLRLLEIRSNARGESDRSKLEEMAGETDDLAASVARHALRRAAEPHTLAAATLAVDAARSTVARRLGRGLGSGAASA